MTAADRVVREVSHRDFSDLFPRLAATDARIAWTDASARMRRVLDSQGNPSWRDIASMTPSALLATEGWQDLDMPTLLELLRRGLALEASQGLVTDPGLYGDLGEENLGQYVSLIGVWGRSEQGAMTLSEALDLISDLETDEIPDEIRHAYTAVRDLDLWRLPSLYEYRYSLLSGLEYVLSRIDERERYVFERRELQPDKSLRPTLEELGEELGVTRERVRQLGKRAQERVLAAVDDPRGLVVRRTSSRVRRALGLWVLEDRAWSVAFGFMRIRGIPVDVDAIVPRLLLWLAGPFRLSQGWLLAENRRTAVQQTSEVLRELLARDKVTWPDAIGEVQELGAVDEATAEQWLKDIPGFRELDGYLVRWDGGLADKAETVLSIRGEAMSREAILEVIGYGSKGSLGNHFAQDPRFVRLDRDLFGLSAWGGEEYVGIVGLIGREIDRDGGAILLPELIESLASRYTVAANSIAAYASSHPDFIVVDGVVRRRRSDDHIDVKAEVWSEAACYRLGSGWAWRRRVDHDVLRGSGMTIPPGFALTAGLRHGEVRPRQSEYGEISFSWRGMQPTIGSLRVPAAGLGAIDGDWLFVELESDDGVRFHLLRAADLEAIESRRERFCRLIGADPVEFDRAPLVTIQQVLGSAVPLASFAAAATLLRSRGEPELADLLPMDDNGDAINDVLRHLGL